LHKALQPDRLQPLAHLARARNDSIPGDVLARIEIEDQPVGLLQSFDRRSPRMDLHHTRLHETNQAAEVVDREHRLAITRVDPPDPFTETVPGMLGEEALLADAGW